MKSSSCNRTLRRTVALARLVRGLMTAVAVGSLALACSPGPSPEPPQAQRLDLSTGWHLAAGTAVGAGGAEISGAGFATTDWVETAVPSTVLAALVRAGVYEDPYFADRLATIPTEQFEGGWWFRAEVDLPERPAGSSTRLDLDGINYRANVWLNDRRVADESTLFGAFRRFRLDVSEVVVPGRNVLAIEVLPPRPGDFTVGFVDWNPSPPDRNMGLWRGVSFRLFGPVSLDDLFVKSDLPDGPAGSARLTISGRVENRSPEAVSGRLVAELGGKRIAQPYELAAGESREVVLSPEEHQELVVAEPRLWWPHNLGTQELYELSVSAEVADAVSDRTSLDFGIREVEDYLNDEGHRGYRINGREVLIKGGGWVDDLMLVEDPKKLEDQLLYARHLGLNTIRLEGFWGSTERLYDLADRLGLLVMVGWSCQWEWEEYLGGPVDDFGGVDTAEETDLIAKSLADQVTWLRNHPSIFTWVLGSDMLPRPSVESRYRADLATLDPTRPPLASCAVRTSEVSGPTGVKMNGPYDWVPPSYWYVDATRGGAFGFNTETGPGPQPPPLESLKRMMPEENLWPIDEMWAFHSGRNEFSNIERYRKALDARYGPSDDVEELLRKSQAASYEAMRAMFEAFAVRRPNTTGIIQWMLNSAWPELFWQLWDYYLMPNGAFYGARAAGEPLQLVYDYGEKAVVAVNQTLEPASGLSARVRVLDLTGRTVHEHTHTVDVPADRSAMVAAVTPPAGSTAFFLDLQLTPPGGGSTVHNFYWLPAREDVLDDANATWFYTPVKRYADLTALSSLPTAALDVETRMIAGGEESEVLVTLKNRGPGLAFQVELRVLDGATGSSVLPVFWDDNYVSIPPGEERALRARFRAPESGSAESPLRLMFAGWNVGGGERTLGDAQPSADGES